MQPVYLRRRAISASAGFNCSAGDLAGRLPQILTGIRIALGVAWLVVVAAEMIA